MPVKSQDILLEIAPATTVGASTPADADFDTIGYLRSKGLTRSTATIDTSSDNDPDNTSAIPGMKSFNFSGEALYVYDDTGQQAIETAYDAQDSDNLPWMRLTSNTVGDNEFIGQVIITELDLAPGSTNEVATYSISTEGVGAITKQAIT